MINISWDSFDKAFWLSSTNIANLIRSSIDIDVNIGQVETDVDGIHTDINDINQDIADLNQNVQGEIDALRDTTDAMLSRIEVLEEKVDGGGGGGGGGDQADITQGEWNMMQNVVQNLVNANVQRVAEILDLQAEVTGLKSSVLDLTHRVDALEGK